MTTIESVARPTLKGETTAQALLSEIVSLDRRINAKLELRAHYMDLACKTTRAIDGPRYATGIRENRVEDFTLRLVDLEREINEEIDTLVDRRRQAAALIDTMADPRHKELLDYRYIHNWGWEKISEAMHYDRVWIWRLHKDAIAAAQAAWQEQRGALEG